MNARTNFLFAAVLLGCLTAASCSDNTKSAKGTESVKEPAKEPTMNVPMNMQITSTAFTEGQPIPEKYTCSGEDVSPPLTWSNAPAGTKSFALITDDPDAPMRTWVHWVIFNLPSATTSLPENTPKSPELPDGAKQGVNDFHQIGYGGPCPPPGKPHRYYFKIYALDTMLDLRSGVTKEELLKAMEGHALGQGQLMGRFQREPR
jgi:Raf kinase inhibitor-like YbhB/YbcL family protein